MFLGKQKFDSGPNGAGIGIREEQLHSASGLRVAQLAIPCRKDFSGVSGGSPTWGGLAGASVTQWASIRTGLLADGTTNTGGNSAATSWRGRMIVPATPQMALVVASLTAAVSFRFRITGLDQFGCNVVEITPWIRDLNWAASTAASTATEGGYAYLITASKVFSHVFDVEYQSTGVVGGSSTFSMGLTTVLDPAGIQASAIDWDAGGAGGTTNVRTMGTMRNFGWGTPLRISPYGNPTAATIGQTGSTVPAPFRPEVLGATIHMVRAYDGTTATAINSVTSIPVLGDPSAGNTGLTIGDSAPARSDTRYSVDAWQGCPHKIGIRATNENISASGGGTGWVTKIGDSDGLTGSSTRASGTPTSIANFSEDEYVFYCTLRTTIGTRRNTNPDTIYVRG